MEDKMTKKKTIKALILAMGVTTLAASQDAGMNFWGIIASATYNNTQFTASSNNTGGASNNNTSGTASNNNTYKSIPQAVKFVPYNFVISDMSGEIVGITGGALPNGLTLESTGEISGIPKETGTFTFKVSFADNLFSEYTLEVLDNTDENVDISSTDEGYELTQPMEDINLESTSWQDHTVVSVGEYSEFQDVYLDGEKLKEGEDYISESGSTRITILAETLKRAGEGSHTLVIEFKDAETGLRKYASQNYTVVSKKPESNTTGSSSTFRAAVQEAVPVPESWTNVLAKLKISTEKDLVVYTGEEIRIPREVLNAVKENTSTLMMQIGGGISFSISKEDVTDSMLNSELNLSVKERKINISNDIRSQAVEGASAVSEFMMEDKGFFGGRINVHFSLGKENAGKFANLFYYDQESEQLDLVGLYPINERGQAMFGIFEGGDYLLTVTNQASGAKLVGRLSGQEYVVKPGDTLWGIAGKYHKSIQELQNLNPAIQNLDLIYVGTRIVVN